MSVSDRRVHRSWGERFVLEPIFYWGDLYGKDGRPSHTKGMTFLGFLAALTAEIWWGFTLAEAGGINGAYVTLVLGTLAFAMGKSTFEKVIGLRVSVQPDTYGPHPHSPYNMEVDK